MTYAPADLLAVRQYLLASIGLSGDAVGIVGDPDHASTGGYHEGNDDLARVGRLNTDYSKRESTRDRPGTNGASAIDIGSWGGRRGKAQVTWLEFILLFVAACLRGDPRTRDVRETIYTPDGSTVRRFDRLGVRSTGDSSHLYHLHISLFRASEGTRAQPGNIFGLFHEIIEGEVVVGIMDDLSGQALVYEVDAITYGYDKIANGPHKGHDVWTVGVLKRLEAAAAADAARDAANNAAIQGLVSALAAGDGDVDVAGVVTGIAEKINDAVHRAVEPLQVMVAQLRVEVAEGRRREAAAAAAAAEQLRVLPAAPGL